MAMSGGDSSTAGIEELKGARDIELTIKKNPCLDLCVIVNDAPIALK